MSRKKTIATTESVNAATEGADTSPDAASRAHPKPVLSDQLIARGRIHLGERLRAVDADHALFTGESMRDQGQLQPIAVRPHPEKPDDFILIFGAHRFVGAGLVDIWLLRTDIYDVDAAQARLMEIDENLVDFALTELDRAAFLAERKRVWEEMYPQTKHGGDRSQQVDRPVDLPSRFTAETAERIGVSERTIQRSVKRHNAIDAGVRTRISSTWLARNGGQLDALAKVDRFQQSGVVELMLSGAADAPKTVAEALARMSNRPAPVKNERDEQGKALLKAWKNAGAGAREDFLAFLEGEGLVTKTGYVPEPGTIAEKIMREGRL